jgi:hypothetical protein
MTETVDTPPKIASIVERYIALRDRKAELKAAYTASVEAIDTAMDRAELFLMGTLQELGVESFKTEFGTAYTSTKTSATVADWDACLNWARANEEWTLLTRGVSKDFVKAYKVEHNDLPPGVNWREEKTVNIRKNA